jgi:hypothetical protein
MDWLLFLFLAAIYFPPWLVAASRKHHNRGAICALNLEAVALVAGHRPGAAVRRDAGDLAARSRAL